MNTDARLPAEWESQSAVMLAWPPEDMPEAQWRPRGERALTRMARLAAECQPVLIVCASAADEQRVVQSLSGIRPDRLYLCRAPVNDIWIRDYGPLTIPGTRPAGVAGFSLQRLGRTLRSRPG